MNFETIIGLELHLQLKTNSKLFSNALNSSSLEANAAVSPIDIAYPGFLPTVNSKCIECALMLAFALNCKINPFVTFDRKNYFYHDLAKGYQITQHRFPIGTDGEIHLDGKTFRIKEIHLEEDTAKQILDNENIYLDYNRSGIPLIEIVFESDIRNSDDAKKCLKYVIQLSTFLGISDGKLEDGSLRCDANVSLRPFGSNKLNPYFEIKNLNSVKNLGLALERAIEQQNRILLSGGVIYKQTYSYADSTKSLQLLRDKCDEQGYCYIPETNIAPIFLSNEFVFDVYHKMPELPASAHHRFEHLGISHETIDVLISDIDLKNLFDACLLGSIDPILLANFIINNVSSFAYKNNISLIDLNVFANSFTKLTNLVSLGNLSYNSIKDKVGLIINGDISDVDSLMNINLVDDDVVVDYINKILDSNKEILIEYKNGKNHLIKYLMGLIIKEFKDKIDPKNVSTLLLKEIEKR